MDSDALARTIGDNIKKLRDRLGLSQRQLADLVGMTQGALNSYENAHRAIPLRKLLDLAAALKVSPLGLLGQTPFGEYTQGYQDGRDAGLRHAASLIARACDGPGGQVDTGGQAASAAATLDGPAALDHAAVLVGGERP